MIYEESDSLCTESDINSSFDEDLKEQINLNIDIEDSEKPDEKE